MISIKTLLFLSLAVLGITVKAQPIAFPSAEGFGKYTSGGRGGRTLVVSNLNDGGEGSLRKAIQASGPRVIVFAVSGNISLESPLDINKGDITIAGQSAPGDGICIKNYPVSIKANNVIIRYIRFRMGDEKKVEGDALGANSSNNNIIIDHCSMSWATDECASFYRNKDFTLQWCMITESLNASVHAKGDHGYGGIWGGMGASFHHNLIASHSSRTPRFSGSSTTPNSKDELVDFSNNVIYNWGSNSTYGGEKGRYNVVNNYYKAGPATAKQRATTLLNPWAPFGRFFVKGNVLHNNVSISRDNWSGGVRCEGCDSIRMDTAFPVQKTSLQSAEDAYHIVLKHAGASYKRDQVDSRIVNEVRTGKSTSGKLGKGLIDSPADVGSWPDLKTYNEIIDSDLDGMPDDWERKHGLNPKSAEDSSKYSIDKEYTNIEVYLNAIVAAENAKT
ncbi:pectate lyase [Arcticibacter pallidicorallinus]|uniref:Pectate lyase n=1 Tax=Arcticibacter pallidicorallinus TaxID=1259464 RepID=A0A2T0UBT7_9SPHI|nr:pectate lyase [Arcticibacter pallidicorallinus]PRY55354.1 pectate lyase [Arcticibacter pallidicorallinus]